MNKACTAIVLSFIVPITKAVHSGTTYICNYQKFSVWNFTKYKHIINKHLMKKTKTKGFVK